MNNILQFSLSLTLFMKHSFDTHWLVVISDILAVVSPLDILVFMFTFDQRSVCGRAIIGVSFLMRHVCLYISTLEFSRKKLFATVPSSEPFICYLFSIMRKRY